jgi:hypothetical protein
MAIAVSGGDVYVAATVYASSDQAVYWKNGVQVPLPPMAAERSAEVTSIVVVGSDVYVSGTAYDASWQPFAGHWKNGVWFPGDRAQSSARGRMVVDGTDVYLGGYAIVGGTYEPGYLKNGVWNALSELEPKQHSEVRALFVSGGDVYAGGYSTDADGRIIAGYWNNGDWVALPSLSTNGSFVYGLHVEGADVYAAGISRDGSGMNVAGYWKNGEWNALDVPEAYTWVSANCITAP